MFSLVKNYLLEIIGILITFVSSKMTEPKLKLIFKKQPKNIQPVKAEYKYDTWNKWTDKSSKVNFVKSGKKAIGNGEEKLARELDITNLGGQNSVIDLKHNILGDISVKDMTKDDCILGAEGAELLRTIFRKIVFPLLSWCEKYKDTDKYAKDIWESLEKCYGRSRINLNKGIERFELCNSNLVALNQILDDLMITIRTKNKDAKNEALNSEYIKDIYKNMNGKSLIDKLNDCVRTEARISTLIIVHKTKGWLIVKDLDKIVCPRVTLGSPRINYIGR